jgi:hypothetical protein
MHERSGGWEMSLHIQSLVGFAIDTHESSFWKRHQKDFVILPQLSVRSGLRRGHAARLYKPFGTNARSTKLDRLLFFRLRAGTTFRGRHPNRFVFSNTDHARDRLIDHVDNRVFYDRRPLS